LDEKLMRRVSIQIYLIIILLVSACGGSISATQPASAVDAQAIPSSALNEITGRVVGVNGAPVASANIKVGTTIVLTDADGWFHLPSDAGSQWVTVYKAGYISRTRAAKPGRPVLIRISPDDGKTIVLKFTGGVMFGRRFFDANFDGDTSDGLLPLDPSIGDHAALLQSIAPLLSDADITTVNLETALDTHPYLSPLEPRPATFNQAQELVFATHPNAIAALKKVGVDLVGMGNNHTYDMLDEGVLRSMNFLQQAGMPYFGAGMNEAQAWTPAVIEVKGQRIAFIGCTSLIDNYPDPATIGVNLVASDEQKKGGAAYCETAPLRAAVIAARKISDLVVVQIHGGEEYQRVLPPFPPTRLSEVARQAGAALVINHHPHVVSGFSWNGDSIVARSLGNFIFDQTVWPTYETYMFTVYIQDGKVIRAFIDPLMMEENIARGVTAELADYVARRAAGTEAGPYIMESDTMEFDLFQRAKQVSKNFVLDGGPGTIVRTPDGTWLSDFSGSGTLLLGRDLLWVGGFENDVVGNTPGYLPLWIPPAAPNLEVGPEFAYEGQAGIRLIRYSANKATATTTNLNRILVNAGTSITICGMFRSSSDAAPDLQISWYPETHGPSSLRVVEPLTATKPSTWQYFQFDMKVPEDIAALQVYFRLPPPTTGQTTLELDNLQIIEWAPNDPNFNPLYNFAYLIGSGDLTFSQSMLPGGESWLTLPNIESLDIVSQQGR
jgi:poly-gamma-glutamate synthesis protein (capsule biosynthesis protein)